MKILIGSCVRQRPEILTEFLKSLEKLKIPGEFQYYFIQSDLEPKSKEILNAWYAPGQRAWLFDEMNFNDEYRTDENTHHWNSRLVTNVIQLRNEILRRAREDDVDFLLMVDSDAYIRPDTLKQLLFREKDIIGEISWTIWKPGEPPRPGAWFFDNYGFPPDGMERLRKESLLKVGGFGGLYLISKNALQKGVSFSRVEGFSPEWGEDRHFAARAHVLGFDLWVDTTLPWFHIYRMSDLPRLQEWKQSGFRQFQTRADLSAGSVFIAIPHTEHIRAETMSWVVSTISTKILCSLNLSYGMPVDSNRNQIVKRFLTDPQAQTFEYLLMVDSDIVPPPGALERLLSHKKKIVSAVVWSMMPGEKGSKWEDVAMPYPIVMKRSGDGKGWNVDRESIARSPGGLIEVDATGGGCLLIHREVLEKVGKNHFRFGYDEWGISNFVGEDFSFCMKVKELGYQIYVDLAVICEHYKTLGLRGISRLLEKTEQNWVMKDSLS